MRRGKGIAMVGALVTLAIFLFQLTAMIGLKHQTETLKKTLVRSIELTQEAQQMTAACQEELHGCRGMVSQCQGTTNQCTLTLIKATETTRKWRKDTMAFKLMTHQAVAALNEARGAMAKANAMIVETKDELRVCREGYGGIHPLLKQPDSI